MKEHLPKAIDSGDTDLVYLVLLHIKRSYSPAEFFRMIKGKQSALSLMIQYAKQQDLELLKDLYYQVEQPHEIANIAVVEACTKPDLDGRLKGLNFAAKLYVENKDHQYSSKATEEQVKLLLLQKDLELTLGGQYIDLSLGETIYRVLIAGDMKRPYKIKDQFKVPDKRFWWIKVKAIGQMRLWTELFSFSKEKKSPIGYEPFVDVCLEQGSTVEASKYIPKIQNPQVRAEYFQKIGYWKEAADSAKEAKDIPFLEKLRSDFSTRESQQYIDTILQQLKK